MSVQDRADIRPWKPQANDSTVAGTKGSFARGRAQPDHARCNLCTSMFGCFDYGVGGFGGSFLSGVRQSPQGTSAPQNLLHDTPQWDYTGSPINVCTQVAHRHAGRYPPSRGGHSPVTNHPAVSPSDGHLLLSNLSGGLIFQGFNHTKEWVPNFRSKMGHGRQDRIHHSG